MRGIDRRRFGVRVTVLLVFAVGVLSIATGIVNITTTPRIGAIGSFVPDAVAETAGFTGTLTGFVLLSSALGLRRGLRIAWWSSVVLLPVTAIQGLVQASPYSLPLIVASVIAFPVVAVNRVRFDRAVQLTTSQIAAGLALAGVQFYGTVGSFVLREEFNGVETIVDAFYFTLVTASTVGYGDISPLSARARLFGMSLVLLGTASFAIAIGVLLGPAIEARFTSALGKMTNSQLELLDDHVIVLGYGDLTEPILLELTEAASFLIVTPDPQLASELGERGFKVLTADPSDEEPLRRAGIDDARAVVAATNNDAEDALAVLTARQLNPSIRIVAAATDRENVDKLKRAGADTVISPAAIGGHLLVQAALGREGMEDRAQEIVDETDHDNRTGRDDRTDHEPAR